MPLILVLLILASREIHGLIGMLNGVRTLPIHSSTPFLISYSPLPHLHSLLHHFLPPPILLPHFVDMHSRYTNKTKKPLVYMYSD